VLIPCHRVVRSDGGLAGYRWGIHRKRAMLEKETRNSTSARLAVFRGNAPSKLSLNRCT
jgi:alkylated DNA nucleotide flippase Atl1